MDQVDLEEADLPSARGMLADIPHALCFSCTCPETPRPRPSAREELVARLAVQRAAAAAAAAAPTAMAALVAEDGDEDDEEDEDSGGCDRID